MIYMEEHKTADPAAENQDANQNADNAGGDTTDGSSGADNAGSGVEKKDYSKMSIDEIKADLASKHKDKTPEQLLEELAKQMEIVGHKNRAIESMKKKSNDKKDDVKQVGGGDELDKPITKKDLLEIRNRDLFEAMVKNATSDEKERTAIMEAYNNDIVKSGDVEKDLKKALAIANVGVVEEYKKNRAIAENNESYLARFSGGGSYGSASGNNLGNDVVKRQVADNLRRAGLSEDAIAKALAKT